MHNEPDDASVQIELLFRRLERAKTVDLMETILREMEAEMMGAAVAFSPSPLYNSYLSKLDLPTKTETEKHGSKATPDRKV